MAQVAHPRLVTLAFLVQPRVRVGGRMMRVAGTLLTLEIDGWIAPAILGRRAAAVLFDKTFHRCPCFNLGAIDREMFVRNHVLPLRDEQDLGEETLRHTFTEQALAAGAECRVIPNCLVDIHADKAAIEQVVFNVLDELAFGTDREQNLDQTGSEQTLGRYRRTSTTRVQRCKLRTHALQNSIDENAQLAQRMRLRNALFQRSVAEHGVLGDVGLAHGFEGESCFHYTTLTLTAPLTGRWDFSTDC